MGFSPPYESVGGHTTGTFVIRNAGGLERDHTGQAEIHLGVRRHAGPFRNNPDT